MPIDGSGEPLYTSIVFVVNASAKASEVKLRAASAAKANNFNFIDLKFKRLINEVVNIN
jgi:hypothetical protein